MGILKNLKALRLRVEKYRVITKLTVNEEKSLKLAEKDIINEDVYSFDETLKMLNVSKQELNLNE